MSKSLKLYLGAAAGTVVVLGTAYAAANASVDYPEVAVTHQKSAPVAAADAPAPQDEADAPVRLAEAHQARTTASDASHITVPTTMPEVSTEAGRFGLGRAALPEEVAAWNHDIMPDGSNLPVGSGDVWTGDEVFAEHCASCHGDFAEGRDNWPKLAGGQGTLADKDPLKTVGSYWPYLSTTFDYIRRSMPFGNAQSLSDDDVYAITAYILYSNDLVDDDFVLSNETFMDVEMPNAEGFIVDDRETTEAHFWAEPCMENCKGSVEITMRASVLDVTPDEGEDTATSEETGPPVEEQAAAPQAEPVQQAAAEEAAPEAQAGASIDMALAAEGEGVFKKCKSCHQVGDGAKNRTGPMLNGVVGATIGQVEGFKYSNDMAALGEAGRSWTAEDLNAFLEKPKDFLKKTKMSFAGLRKEEDRLAVIEYLKTFQ